VFEENLYDNEIRKGVNIITTKTFHVISNYMISFSHIPSENTQFSVHILILHLAQLSVTKIMMVYCSLP
jgi:hypothetical protein